VKVTGSRFIKNEKAGIKVEGARPVGYRTISIAGARDPGFLANLETILSGVKRRTTDNFSDLSTANSYRLLFNIYGRDGVMGKREPLRQQIGHEIGIIIEAIAPTQEMANTICSFARSTMLHYGFSGRLCTAGNLAFPYSPSDFPGGAVFEFSLHHLLEGEDEKKLFPIQWVKI
ncbi:MAG TPA: 3-methylaspartate ammonia-lyase, partial [Clostridia bacterium]|nr:3-methylaspartate ammonia-lyase [Clostridia bacterium]